MTDPEPHHDLREALGRAIRARRAECGMTLRELGELTAISYSYLAEIERGTSGKQVSTDKLVKIAEALGISPSELLGRGEQLRDSQALRSRVPSFLAPRVVADVDAGLDAETTDAPPPRAQVHAAEPSAEGADVPEQHESDELRQRITELIENAEVEDLRVIASLAHDLRRRAIEVQRRASRDRRRR